MTALRTLTRSLAACLAGVLLAQSAQSAEQRWLSSMDRALRTDGKPHDFSLRGMSDGPTTMSVQDDGAVWFTLSSGNAIGRMRPDGGDLKIFPLPHANSSPRIIAVGADGNLWFSEHAGNRIGKIAPSGQIEEFDIPTPNSQPRAIALGADGNIWFGLFAAGKIGRITPQGRITEFDIPTPRSGPRAVAAGPDGNIWFSEFYAGKIGRITPQGVVTEFALPRANAGPGDITAGADGAMWFVELSGAMDNFTPDGNRVGRIAVDGALSEYNIPNAGASPINIAVGPDRNIWFTKGASLWRVTVDGAMTEFPLASSARAVGLSAGSDRQPPQRLLNRLWFAGGDRIGYLQFEREMRHAR